MVEKTFTQSQVNKVFQYISARTLKSWVEAGLVGWSGEYEDKRGLHRSYSLKNLYEFALVAELMELNFHFRMIKEMLKSLPPLKDHMGAVLGVYKVYTQDIETGAIAGVQYYNFFSPSKLEFHLKANQNSPYLVLIKLPVIAQRVQNSVKKLG